MGAIARRWVGRFGLALISAIDTGYGLAGEPAANGSAASGAAEPRAQRIVLERCAMCHGVRGESATDLYPRLAGQHAGYLAKQLADYKSGRRKNDTMAQMTADLSERDMSALGKYFEAKRTKPATAPDADLAAAGKYLYDRGNPWSGVPACAFCHGPKAHGNERLPRLAGQQAGYIANQLIKFNQRERSNDNAVMHTIASHLTEFEVRALAEYVSGLD